MTNAQKMALLAVKVAKQVERGAGRGLNAARFFLAARVKETLSEPAPRAAVRAAPLPGQKRGGIMYYRATTPAIPGAPMRKLSSRARTSTVSQMINERTAAVGLKARANVKNPQDLLSNPNAGFNYPAHHEIKQPGHPSSGQHPFLKPTTVKYMKEIKKIVGGNVRVG